MLWELLGVLLGSHSPWREAAGEKPLGLLGPLTRVMRGQRVSGVRVLPYPGPGQSPASSGREAGVTSH